IEDMLEVDLGVEPTDWEANDSAVEVVAVVGIKDVGVVEVAVALVSGGVVEEAVVVE
ncbi:hypothetical protein KI387_000133, partial [Taxus chinensis]